MCAVRRISLQSEMLHGVFGKHFVSLTLLPDYAGVLEKDPRSANIQPVANRSSIGTVGQIRDSALKQSLETDWSRMVQSGLLGTDLDNHYQEIH